MVEIIPIRPNIAPAISEDCCLQVSCYPQVSGDNVYCVEVLHPDGLLDCKLSTFDRIDAWRKAGEFVDILQLPLRPTSVRPSRAPRGR